MHGFDRGPADQTRALFADPAAVHGGVGFVVLRRQTCPGPQLVRTTESVHVTDLGDEHRPQGLTRPRGLSSPPRSRDTGMSIRDEGEPAGVTITITAAVGSSTSGLRVRQEARGVCDAVISTLNRRGDSWQAGTLLRKAVDGPRLQVACRDAHRALDRDSPTIVRTAGRRAALDGRRLGARLPRPSSSPETGSRLLRSLVHERPLQSH